MSNYGYIKYKAFGEMIRQSQRVLANDLPGVVGLVKCSHREQPPFLPAHMDQMAPTVARYVKPRP
jgi:hypothetical protein